MKSRTIYFIRHAATEANKEGVLVKNYNSYHIIPFNKDAWWKEVNKVFPELRTKLLANKTVLVSKTFRTMETAQRLFNNDFDSTLSPYIWESNSLNEFNCETLGDRKFWEVTEQEFEQYVNLTPKDMEKATKEMLNTVLNTKVENPTITYNDDAVVCVSHGMKIRYLIWYLSGRKDISAYKVINSMDGVKFNNLDVLKLEFKKGLFGWKLKDMKYLNM